MSTSHITVRLGSKTAQYQIYDFGLCIGQEIDAALQEHRIDERKEGIIDRPARLIDRRLPFELTVLSALLQNLLKESLEALDIGLHRRPILQRCVGCDLVDFAVVESQVDARRRHGFGEFPK